MIVKSLVLANHPPESALPLIINATEQDATMETNVLSLIAVSMASVLEQIQEFANQSMRVTMLASAILLLVLVPTRTKLMALLVMMETRVLKRILVKQVFALEVTPKNALHWTNVTSRVFANHLPENVALPTRMRVPLVTMETHVPRRILANPEFAPAIIQLSAKPPTNVTKREFVLRKPENALIRRKRTVPRVMTEISVPNTIPVVRVNVWVPDNCVVALAGVVAVLA